MIINEVKCYEVCIYPGGGGEFLLGMCRWPLIVP